MLIQILQRVEAHIHGRKSAGNITRGYVPMVKSVSSITGVAYVGNMDMGHTFAGKAGVVPNLISDIMVVRVVQGHRHMEVIIKKNKMQAITQRKIRNNPTKPMEN